MQKLFKIFSHLLNHIIGKIPVILSNTRALEQHENIAFSSPKNDLKPLPGKASFFRAGYEIRAAKVEYIELGKGREHSFVSPISSRNSYKQPGSFYAISNSKISTHIIHITNAKFSNTRAMEQHENIATTSPKNVLKPLPGKASFFRARYENRAAIAEYIGLEKGREHSFVSPISSRNSYKQPGSFYAISNSKISTHIAHITNAKLSNTRAVEQHENIATSSPKNALKALPGKASFFRVHQENRPAFGENTGLEKGRGRSSVSPFSNRRSSKTIAVEQTKNRAGSSPKNALKPAPGKASISRAATIYIYPNKKF